MKVVSADFETMDSFAELWYRVMTEVRKSPLSQAEKIGVLEYIKHDILTDMMASRDSA